MSFLYIIFQIPFLSPHKKRNKNMVWSKYCGFFTFDPIMNDHSLTLWETWKIDSALVPHTHSQNPFFYPIDTIHNLCSKSDQWLSLIKNLPIGSNIKRKIHAKLDHHHIHCIHTQFLDDVDKRVKMGWTDIFQKSCRGVQLAQNKNQKSIVVMQLHYNVCL